VKLSSPKHAEAGRLDAAVGTTALLRRLGAFDATMIVMGGIIGSGIFLNPTVVAKQVHTPALILGAWIAGGVIALLGAFAYAELAALRPEVGGQYAYLRDAYHPSVAFMYGWALLLIVQSGGMAAVAATFARYALSLVGIAVPEWTVAVAALLILTLINCLGVRSGSNTQNALMLMKLAAIAMLIVAGATVVAPHAAPRAMLDAPLSTDLFLRFGAAMTPVMFAYGGWQTASFVSGELARPRRDLPIGLLVGIIGVIAIYVGVSFVCVRALGADGLANAATPASAVMRLALGERGARLIAAGIAISTLGFLSQSMLTAPRVYYAMAADGLFFKSVGRISAKTHVPVVAIALQGLVAIVITVSGTYEQILSYVVSTDFIFFGLTGLALFIFRRRQPAAGFRTPGHPFTTGIFTLSCWTVVIATIVKSPVNSLIGFAILAAGLPAYAWWRRRAAPSS
jgi:APA family basic amino acid/polyamine antiporter